MSGENGYCQHTIGAVRWKWNEPGLRDRRPPAGGIEKRLMSGADDMALGHEVNPGSKRSDRMTSQRFEMGPDANEAVMALQRFVNQSTLPRPLLELVRMRSSQLNGCAYCLNMHSKDALALGVPAEKLYVLEAWREAPFYGARERAALEWAEAVTLVADGHVADAVFDAVRAHFTEHELAELTMAIVAINAWNRIAISTRMEPGHYQSRLSPKVEAAARCGRRVWVS
jgi:AhpD family alkylhydroperoxidase